MQRQQFGPDNKHVLWTTADLALALSRQQKFDEAEAVCAASIDAMRRVLGDDDPATIAVGRILAEAIGRRGDQAGAAAGPNTVPPQRP